MDIVVHIKKSDKKREPCNTSISFCVKKSQKEALDLIKSQGLIDVNDTIRKCIDSIIDKALPKKD